MLAQHLSVGSVLHGVACQYTIKKVLGQGTFGITYLATTELEGLLGRLPVNVALKEFFVKDLNGRSEDGSVREVSSDSIVSRYGKAFQRESLNLSHMRHPGIIRVLESFEANNTYYYAMEYVDGGSLDSYILSKGKLSEKEAVDCINAIGSALSYMHEQKMLHLDLKPKNIMLRTDGSPVLIDFGLSKQYDSTGEPESSSTIGLGTPGYAPIEQANSSSGRDFAATLDIYALGGTFYKMLTGKSPVGASIILNDGFPEDELRNSGVSDRSIAAIEKAMSPQRKSRPQSVQEFLSLLDGGRPVASEVPAADEEKQIDSVVGSSSASPAVPRRKFRLALWLTLCLWSVLGGAFAGWYFMGGEESLLSSDVVVSDGGSPSPVAPPVQSGSLKVSSTPSGASIWIDGRNTGKTTPEILEDIAVGSHKIVLKHDGYQDGAKQVSVSFGKRTECTVTLTKIPEPAKPSTPQNYTETALGVNMKMVYVAGGTFTMGATLEQGYDEGYDAWNRAKPTHQVSLSGYYIGAFEVTQGQWEKVMGTSVTQQRDKLSSSYSLFGVGSDYPIYYVSWDEAQAFCRELSRRTGKRYVLPTEAQWEYAARGGNKNEETKYSGSWSIDAVAWYDGNSNSSTHPVGTKRPNALGLYDMSGNVWEWCADWYGFYPSTSQTNPTGLSSGSYRVNRGGSYDVDAGYCLVSLRRSDSPSFRSSLVGFRVVCLPSL
ncbi:SUMF1/EgtB/PvdO family nonheme iron enzyme [Odoribacter lunatus]|uniref:SUMF1/EgtB/PvdO family nonheme iron enzyme n=1 Tax=Odoribacter lunatus TaxID=2941335 RepID=UPI0020405968|nr:SUMF1/EgtB/PvdO family nonheme iron enzyme [Odoribacter lunatus]